MPRASWSAVEALVAPLFAGGQTPDRSDLVQLASDSDADDDVLDALDSLGPRPLASLEALKEQLTANGVVE